MVIYLQKACTLDPFSSSDLRSRPQGPVLLPVRVISKERTNDYGHLIIEINYGNENVASIRRYAAGVIFDKESATDSREEIWNSIEPGDMFVLRPVTLAVAVGNFQATNRSDTNESSDISTVEFIHINGVNESIFAMFKEEERIIG